MGTARATQWDGPWGPRSGMRTGVLAAAVAKAHNPEGRSGRGPRAG